MEKIVRKLIQLSNVNDFSEAHLQLTTIGLEEISTRTAQNQKGARQVNKF
jgi:hypothetical protein